MKTLLLSAAISFGVVYLAARLGLNLGANPAAIIQAGAATWAGGAALVWAIILIGRANSCQPRYVGNTQVRQMPARERQAWGFDDDRTIDVPQPAARTAPPRAVPSQSSPVQAGMSDAERRRELERFQRQQAEQDRRTRKQIAEHETRQHQAEAARAREEREAHIREERAEQEALAAAAQAERERRRHGDAFAQGVDIQVYDPDRRRAKAKKTK